MVKCDAALMRGDVRMFFFPPLRRRLTQLRGVEQGKAVPMRAVQFRPVLAPPFLGAGV